MLDPREGLTRHGKIRTGADRERIPRSFLAQVDDARIRVHASAPAASLYVYGSVATGTAQAPTSDVDLLTVGLSSDRAVAIGQELSDKFAHLCRGVEIAAVTAEDLRGEGDEAYGFRVFLHHYCVHVHGPDVDQATSAFAGDQRAARGFNGDIAQHAARWRRDLDDVEPAVLGRRIARKSLLALAALVSVLDATWTTDRETAARRWQQVHPERAADLDELLEWSSLRTNAREDRVRHQLDTTIDRLVREFTTHVGLWST